MNIVCVGAGYVGTVTGAAFAALGNKTTIIDTEKHKVDLINNGQSPIYEPGLESLIKYGISTESNFSASGSYHSVQSADIVMIAVGTPSFPDGTANLTHVKTVAKCIAQHLNTTGFTVVVNKSTLPAGTTDIVASILEEGSGLRREENFSVVSNPEFLREGSALKDVFLPERIIVGSQNELAKRIMRKLYHPIIEQTGYTELFLTLGLPYELDRPKPNYFETDPKSAEIIKYASNAFLAVKISYINEMARLCESLGADVLDVAQGIGMDSRIGRHFLQASIGWGGSCFPKDTRELIATGRKYGHELNVVEAAVMSNNKMFRYCIEKLQRKLKTLNGKKIGLLGLTFKPNTDDTRETQAAFVAKTLLDYGSSVSVHDPKGMIMFRESHPELELNYCSNAELTARQANAIILLTHWDEYRLLNWQEMNHSMDFPYILDTRNFLDKKEMNRLGFYYEGLGR